jgi:hypothetical protein
MHAAYCKADLNALLFDNQMEEHAKDPKPERPTLGEQQFYENRPINEVFVEISIEQDERVRKNSPFGHLKTWKLIKIIVKSNDDV